MKSFQGRLKKGSLLALVVGLAAVPASADDAALRERIEGRLKKAKVEQAGEVTVQVQMGRAVLDGAVTSLEAQRAAEKAARKEVKEVENRIRVYPEMRPDADIRKDASNAILGYPWYSIFDSVEMGVEDGVVVLKGSVNQPYRKNDIEERVAHVRGVRAIQSDIQVQSASLFDDRLRYQVARAIYGDQRFVQYAHRADPPIHIIVDRGRITLTGYVSSRVEQVVLGHIARGTLAFGVDNRVLVDGDTPKEPVKASVPTKS
jgi:hyperosmotically inducible protein